MCYLLFYQTLLKLGDLGSNYTASILGINRDSKSGHIALQR
jgi:hypothetical protein